MLSKINIRRFHEKMNIYNKKLLVPKYYKNIYDHIHKVYYFRDKKMFNKLESDIYDVFMIRQQIFHKNSDKTISYLLNFTYNNVHNELKAYKLINMYSEPNIIKKGVIDTLIGLLSQIDMMEQIMKCQQLVEIDELYKKIRDNNYVYGYNELINIQRENKSVLEDNKNIINICDRINVQKIELLNDINNDCFSDLTYANVYAMDMRTSRKLQKENINIKTTNLHLNDILNDGFKQWRQKIFS